VINTNEWVKKMWHMSIIDYYYAVKKNEIMSFSGKEVELEITMWSKTSQAQSQVTHFSQMWILDLR
jgi:hypothetical protein